jgi:hypothetical protein
MAIRKSAAKIESPRFGCSVLTGRSLKQIERDGAKKVLRRAQASI